MRPRSRQSAKPSTDFQETVDEIAHRSESSPRLDEGAVHRWLAGAVCQQTPVRGFRKPDSPRHRETRLVQAQRSHAGEQLRPLARAPNWDLLPEPLRESPAVNPFSLNITIDVLNCRRIVSF